MSSLIISITVRDPQLLGFGITKTMELRGEGSEVPSESLKPISAMLTAELMADLKSARSQGKQSKDRQLELMPQSADEHRPLNPVDDGITMSESLSESIDAWLKEDERRSQEEQDAAETVGKMIQLFRDALPDTDDVNIGLTSVLTQLQQMAPADVLREWIMFPASFDDATHAVDFCKAMFRVEITLAESADTAETVDPDTGEISDGGQDGPA